jgi:hypothetical protein
MNITSKFPVSKEGIFVNDANSKVGSETDQKVAKVSQKKVNWNDSEECVLIPTRKELIEAKYDLWDNKNPHGLNSIIARNDPEELKELSDSMLELKLSDSESKIYEYENLLKLAKSASNPLVVDQSSSSFDEEDYDGISF